jgi:hypothetical protein
MLGRRRIFANQAGRRSFSMKKNLWFILAALLAWGGYATPAGAQGEGFYLSPKLGASMFYGKNNLDGAGYDHDAKTGHSTRFAGALAVGYDFSLEGAPIRTELEFTMRAPFKPKFRIKKI